jgi:UDP-N-acetyl-D-mannosaminuronic acid transferase (WecB/TagA/CpsF family)
MYGDPIEDEALLAALRATRPRHIVVTIGGGTQERLGLYLKNNLEFRPAIHCIGAAISFLSGDQVKIPIWADKLFIGWLFRCLSEPRRYVSRYWSARKLLPLLLKYRERLPSAEI